MHAGTASAPALAKYLRPVGKSAHNCIMQAVLTFARLSHIVKTQQVLAEHGS